MIGKRFDPADDARLLALKARGLCWIDIGIEMNYRASQCRQRYFTITKVPTTRPVTGHNKKTIPDHVWADAERRKALAHRDLTAAFNGDPKPGYGADCASEPTTPARPITVATPGHRSLAFFAGCLQGR